ncbi:hypothetical protein Xmau_02049 [Xenorhabdus mauleonii]|uniref:Uncharacterized protein n=1 Tax=Xenorhabdus mauleonii TaxID=351675 RepID=A0A1I3HSC4_9GAMM|nr:hypothetical protein Xmau_02049 [Xenorhabdus mauleonii]SFI38654.1 hypothetical protein SAMN05421680_10148 [Xenorhabdus mauleonii]
MNFVYIMHTKNLFCCHDSVLLILLIALIILVLTTYIPFIPLVT